jgi:transcriptional regulator with XRE-family HTH domain
MPIRGIEIPCTRCGHPVTEFDGTSLREVRVAAGLSLRQMARLIGCSAPYLSDVELRRRRATPRIVAAYEALEEER